MVNFGHIGDSNLHLTVDGHSLTADDADTRHAIEETVYRLVGRYAGSISAEHGVGLLKKAFLPCSVNGEALALMRTLKRSFDPYGILNPGKLLDAAGIAS